MKSFYNTKVFLRQFLLFVPIIIVCLFLYSCTTKGNVVTVTTVKNGFYDGLKTDELAKIDKIKKNIGTERNNKNLGDIINRATQFSIGQYIKMHPEAIDASSGDYLIGGNDILNIIVYEEKDLSRKEIRVSGNGFISFPLLGRLKVDGLTTSHVEYLISQKLATGGYLHDAHVSVMVTQYNSKRFRLLGAVKNPGSYSLKGPERVIDAISRAGGISSAGKKCKIIRTENPNTSKERKIVIDIDLYALMQEGNRIYDIFMIDKDVLFIPPSESFFIIGQIKRPSSYSMPNQGISLVEAISMAGGFTHIAARNRTRIIRIENGVEKIYEVKVDNITKAGKKIQDVKIIANDVIVVPQSFF